MISIVTSTQVYKQISPIARKHNAFMYLSITKLWGFGMYY